MKTLHASICCFAIAASILTGCGYGKPACTVIDAAKDACAVLRYLAPDGTTRDVRVPASELGAFGLAYAEGRAAALEPIVKSGCGE